MTTRDQLLSTNANLNLRQNGTIYCLACGEDLEVRQDTVETSSLICESDGTLRQTKPELEDAGTRIVCRCDASVSQPVGLREYEVDFVSCY